MPTFTSVTSVSYRYYDKRNRRVAEQAVKEMSKALGLPYPPEDVDLTDRSSLIRYALLLHSKFPENI